MQSNLINKTVLLVMIATGPLVARGTWAAEVSRDKADAAPVAKVEYPDRIWISASPAVTSSDGRSYSGVLVAGGVWLVATGNNREIFGFSLQSTISNERSEDGSPVSRYDILAHGGYRITNSFRAGVILGAEYISLTAPTSADYIKPVMGVELHQDLFSTKHGEISAQLGYRYVGGSTGSLLLNGGSNALSADVAWLALEYGFNLF